MQKFSLLLPALLLSSLLLVTPTFAQQGTVVEPVPPCASFGVTAGTCLQGAGALGTPTSGNGSNITNVNAATLGGATFAAPGPIGSGTPGTGAFTTLGTTGSVNVATASVGAYLNVKVNNATLMGRNASTETYVFSNTDISGNYLINGLASQYAQNAGGHTWSTAVTGTTGNPVTFTDRMKLDSTGLTLITASTDAATTDTTMCRRSSDGLVLTGSGTLGVCLGTSGLQFKQDVKPLPWLQSVWRLMKSSPISYRYKPGSGDGGARIQYGFAAQWMTGSFPELVGHDSSGVPNSFDMLGMFAWLVRVIQILVIANFILAFLGLASLFWRKRTNRR